MTRGTTAKADASESSYRPDIDGLRALAVGAVVLFHAFPKLVPGGFVGVDIFFVISGFLITSAIARELVLGEFRLFAFWARRVRRIFPALLTVLIAVLGLGWLYLLPSEFATLKSHVAWSLGFAANFKLNSEVGYFDVAAELKPLLHLWSLAIEEQFYLLWPAILWLLYRRPQQVFAATAALTVASFATLYLFGTAPSESYYLPWTRFWEILAGALVALGTRDFADALQTIGRPTRHALSATGLLLMLIAVFGFNRHTPFPSVFTLAPVVGAALLLLAGPQAWLNRVVLSLRPLVFVGLISFPLYLWHWPLLSFMRIVFASRMHDGHFSASLTLAIVGTGVALAIATYALVEKPLRRERGAWSWRAPVLTASLAALFVFITTATLLPRSSRLHLEKIDAAIGSWEHPSPTMLRVKFPEPADIEYQEIKTQIDRHTLFIGDSHMEQYGPRVAQLSKDQPADTLSSFWITSGLCLPVDGYTVNTACTKVRLQLHEILKDPKAFGIDRVVWTQYWSAYLEDAVFDQIDASGTLLKGDAKSRARRDAIVALMKAFVTSGVELIVVLDTPHGNEFDPKMMARNVSGAFFLGADTVPRAEAVHRQGQANALLTQAASELRVTLLNPIDALCTVDTCPVRDAQGRPLMKDYEHVTSYSSRERLTYIDRAILKRDASR
jgi:hypothetical protein